MAYSNGSLETVTRGITGWISAKAMGDWIGTMAAIMRENGTRGSSMVKADFFYLMDA